MARKPKPVTHSEREARRLQMAAEVKAGHSYVAVAFRYNVSEITVRQACKEFPNGRKPRKASK